MQDKLKALGVETIVVVNTPLPFVAMETLNRRDGFEPTEVDQQIAAVHAFLLSGHFLIDRGGIIRWLHIEGLEGMQDLFKFPGDEAILQAARAL